MTVTEMLDLVSQILIKLFYVLFRNILVEYFGNNLVFVCKVFSNYLISMWMLTSHQLINGSQADNYSLDFKWEKEQKHVVERKYFVKECHLMYV